MAIRSQIYDLVAAKPLSFAGERAHLPLFLFPIRRVRHSVEDDIIEEADLESLLFAPLT